MNPDMKIKRLWTLFLAFSTAFGCCREEAVQTIGGKVPVSFSFLEGSRTRSSINLDEDAVNDINIICYRDGAFETSRFAESGDGLEILLDEGEYVIYAIANLGMEFSAPSSEDGMKAFAAISKGYASKFLTAKKDDSVQSMYSYDTGKRFSGKEDEKAPAKQPLMSSLTTISKQQTTKKQAMVSAVQNKTR